MAFKSSLPVKFSKRLAALYLNCFINALFTALIILLINHFKFFDLELFTQKFWLWSFLIFTTLVFVDSSLQGKTGANLAKSLLGLKIVDLYNDEPIGFWRSFFRSLLAVLSMALLTLGYFAAAFNKDAKTLHDLLSSSKVIEVEKSAIAKFFSGFLSFISLSIGSLISISLLLLLLASPFVLSRSFYNMSQFASYESSGFSKNPDSKLRINLGADKIYALLEHHNIDYLEFDINKASNESYISEEKLKMLAVNFYDYDYVFYDWQANILNLKIKKVVLIPKLIIKDQNDRDLVVYKQRFVVDKHKNEFGSDFLEIFDYNLDLKSGFLDLQLHQGDREVLADSKLGHAAKNYLVHVLRLIRVRWDEYLKEIPVEALKRLHAVEKKLENDIELNIDLKTGFITGVTLPNPSKNEDFNNICEHFFKQLERFRLIPAELEALEETQLKVNLSYKESI